MDDLHALTPIDDADLADDVEFGVSKASAPAWLKGSFGKLKTYLLATLATRFIPAGGTTGQVLKKNSATDYDIGWGAGGGGGSTNLDGLTDVDTSTTPPTNGQALVYDAGSSLWKPGTIAGGSGGSSPLVCRVSKSANQAIVINDWNHITWDVEEIKDVAGSHSTSANTNRLVVPAGCNRARITAGVSFVGNSSGIRNLAIFKNSEAHLAASVTADMFVFATWHNAEWESGNTIDSGWIDVTPGDYFSITANVDISSPPAVQGDTSFSKSWAQIELASSAVATRWDFKPPLSTDFPHLNSGDATQLTLTDDGDVGLILNTPTVAGEVGRICTKDLPAAGNDWTVIARVNANIFPTNYIETGIFAFESATGKTMSHGLGYEGQYLLNTRLATLTGFRSDPRQIGSGMFVSGDRLWVRMRYDHTANIYYTDYSRNGKTWVNLTSVAGGTAFTTRADRIGLGFSILSTANPTLDMTCDYWWQSW